MSDYNSTWTRIMRMMRAYFWIDDEEAEIAAAQAFKAKETAVYATDVELFAPFPR
jgi:hypothetical protein